MHWIISHNDYQCCRHMQQGKDLSETRTLELFWYVFQNLLQSTVRLAKEKGKKKASKEIFLWHFHPVMPNSQTLMSLQKSLQLHLTSSLNDDMEWGRISMRPSKTHRDIHEAETYHITGTLQFPSSSVFSHVKKWKQSQLLKEISNGDKCKLPLGVFSPVHSWRCYSSRR